MTPSPSTSPSPARGLGGLCLAQALKRRGIAFGVYEQDAAPDSRTQGYRIRIDRTGQAALADKPAARAISAVPADLLALAVGRAVCRRSRAAPSDTWSDTDAGDDGDDGDRSAHRQTLRQILMLGIEDRVHFGQA